MTNTEALLTLDGLSVKVELAATEDGPLLTIVPQDCHAEGILPGEYLLTPLHQMAPAS